MKKNNNTILWIIGIAILFLVVAPQIDFKKVFVITGDETMAREFPSEVDAGTNQEITYIVSGASGDWGASIIDVLKCPGHPDVTKKLVLISDGGGSLIVFYQLPDEEGLICTFEGDYQFGNTPIKDFSIQTIETKTTCILNTSYTCYSNDIYWYDSCGNLGEKKEECLDGCIIGESACIICNTEADTDCDGIVSRTEIGAYIIKWVNNQITRTQLGEAIMAWVG